MIPEASNLGLTSSFAEYLASGAGGSEPSRAAHVAASELTPHATTIVAISFTGGVVMAGDRRATMGTYIAQRDIEKVFRADDYSLVGIAGAAGIATELVRLFQVELEHYEKIEGGALSLDGKANRLSAMLRGNLPMALQGFAVLPLFAGYDVAAGMGRIFSYDATGGRYEEHAFHAVGSGQMFARGSLKKLFRPHLDEAGAAIAAVQALYDAADDDAATSGPDVARQIYPMVMSASARGVRRLDTREITDLATKVIGARMARPDGPEAELL